MLIWHAQYYEFDIIFLFKCSVVTQCMYLVDPVIEMKLFIVWCSSWQMEVISVTLLLCELDGGVGISLSWLVSTGNCS